MNSTPTERMPSGERRELILESATEVFGERGYAGATTDGIARAAGISQAYVVRMFGSKEKLFIEVLNRALVRLVSVFRAAIADHEASGEPAEQLYPKLGTAYIDLIADRGILLSLMQSFAQGHDRVIGEAARCGFLDIYRLLREEAHLTPDEANVFLAHGMMMNTLLGLQLPQASATDPSAAELMVAAFGGKLPLVLDATGKTPA
jgi:TetR/AcrR family transcriptional regulator